MILDNEREVQREFNAVYNHLVELKYALDQKKDSRSNRILGLIRRIEELIHESEVDWYQELVQGKWMKWSKTSSEVEKIKPSSWPNTEYAHQSLKIRFPINLHHDYLIPAASPKVFKRFTDEDDE